MEKVVSDISRTFQEYLLLPGLTAKEITPTAVSLTTPLKKYHRSEGPSVCLNVPFISAAMQSVTGYELAIALARKGGCGFIFCSQSVAEEARMVRNVKEHKAGFVTSDSNLPPSATLRDALELRTRTGHSTIAITDDGKANGRLLGILTSKDYWEFKDDLSLPVTEFFTPMERLVAGTEGISLQEATEKLWKGKKECLPVVDKEGRLRSLVFRRDYFDHKSNPDELTDDQKRLFVGAGINTFDYKERGPALLEAGADVLCLDSSDGYSEWQKEAAHYLRKEFGDALVIGGGNVVCAKGFRYLVEEAGVDFVKIGIGGGSICITREQKGLGRGQASAVMEVARERDLYFAETGIYVPICSDGGLTSDTQIIIALAMGADCVMMGRYFAMTAESPTATFTYQGRLYKPYWGEGSNRARNWERYKQSKDDRWVFEEGVDAYVPYSGSLTEKVDVTLAKLKAAMCNTGVMNLKDFHEKAQLTRVSEMTLIEGGTSTVERLERLSQQK